MIASLLLEPGRLELRDVEIPEPGPGEVVVRVRTALTCGTDLKAFRRGHPKMKIPGPFGHEFAGDVHAEVLASAPRMPALDGKLDFGMALDHAGQRDTRAGLV